MTVETFGTTSLPITPTVVAVVPTPTLPALDQATRAARFDAVWGAVKDHYLYPDWRGVDWVALKEQYRPKALAAASSEEFYAGVAEMVARLNDRHSRYLSPQEAYYEQAVSSGTDTYVGIGVEVTGDAIGGLVRTVYPGSPAEKAGIRRRDHILLIDGQPYAANAAAIRGPEGSIVHLRVQSPGAAPRELEVERRAIVAKRVAEAYRLAGTKTGYLLVQSFWPEDMADQVRDRLQQLLAAGPIDGLIVDVRDNGGGWRYVLQGILASLMQGKTGEFFGKSGAVAFEIAPNELYSRLQATPIVVLVDGNTQSYAEVFAAALQATGRARVVGARSAGNTESIYAYDFEDKSRLWVSQEGFRLPNGVNLEGRGVVPDRMITANWTLFSEAKDPYILTALELLHQK